MDSRKDSYSENLRKIMNRKKPLKTVYIGVINIICAVILMVWCQATNSLGLSAYYLLTILDGLNILTSLLNIWFEHKRPDASFTFGYEQFGVLAVFASTILIQFCSMIILKECIERFIQQPEIHTGRYLPGVVLTFALHLVVTYGVENRALSSVAAACSSSWLQEHMADLSHSLCGVIPGLGTILLPRVNPFLLLGWAGAAVLWLTGFLIEHFNYLVADTLAGLVIVLMVAITVFPMSVFSGKVLLQTTPSHVIGQLDKCLREASTLDGVLEFRHEKFWTETFGKLTGSIHVRIGRDANEQLVLAHLVDRLSNLVSNLTIQVFKDEWVWNSATISLLQESSLRFPSREINQSTPKVISEHSNDVKLSVPKPTYSSYTIKY